jgi:DNA-binding transcriptional MerR regulator
MRQTRALESRALDKAPDAFRTISEVADDLDLPQHVLRFWETRFPQIRPMKRGGGRRFYRREDVELLRGIRHLLYGEGYTIRGVQRILKDHGIKFVQSVWQAGAPQPEKVAGDREEPRADAPAGGAGGEPPRGGRLFGALRARETGGGQQRAETEEEDAEAQSSLAGRREAPPLSVARASRTPQPPARGAPPAVSPPGTRERAAGLSPDQLRNLQAVLQELSECRRLLDAALEDKA